MAGPSKKALAWPVFDHITAEALSSSPSPWTDGRYEPDYDTLCKLLGVPLYLDADTTSGVPALAIDVWVAYELRRSGFEADQVWPRGEHPRVMPGPIASLRDAWTPKRDLATSLDPKILRPTPLRGVVATSANILGKNYVKQVDVVMSAWDTGPEILISTKRMDSSFGKNAANRVEESYGDAKNLRSRHPLAALGFVYALRSTILEQEPDKADWLVDLLGKLGREDDAYDAVGLLMIEYDAKPPAGSDGGHAEEDALAAAGLFDEDEGTDSLEELAEATARVVTTLAGLPEVAMRHDAVPPELDAGNFFRKVITHVLSVTPITMHEDARKLAGWPVARRKARKSRKPATDSGEL